MNKNINVDKIISTTKEVSLHEVGLHIDGITLLSVEEYKKARDYIYPVDNTWWLRSPGYYNDWVVVVSGAGNILHDGNYVYVTYGVRPALRINLKSSDFQIGDSFRFGGHTWTVITKDYALCNSTICKMPFRKGWQAQYWQVRNANDYEESDVKKFLDEWYNKQISKQSTE